MRSILLHDFIIHGIKVRLNFLLADAGVRELVLIVQRVYQERQSDVPLAGNVPLVADAGSVLFLMSDRLRSNLHDLVKLR